MDYTKILTSSLFLVLVVIITLVILIFLIKWILRNVADDKLNTYIDFAKWAIASVALVIIAQVIDAGFKDRQAGITEIEQYGDYVDMVVSADGIGKRWRLAQYFSLVTASGDLRSRWVAYYDAVDKEYKDSLEAMKKYKDSLFKLEMDLRTKKSGRDSAVIKEQIRHYENKLNNINQELDTKLSMPAQQAVRSNASSFLNTDDAGEWEQKGFNYLFSRDADNAIDAFRKSEKIHPGFHSVYDIYTKLLMPNLEQLRNTADDAAWGNLYASIYKNYSWKLNDAIMQQLKSLSR